MSKSRIPFSREEPSWIHPSFLRNDSSALRHIRRTPVKDVGKKGAQAVKRLTVDQQRQASPPQANVQSPQEQIVVPNLSCLPILFANGAVGMINLVDYGSPGAYNMPIQSTESVTKQAYCNPYVFYSTKPLDYPVNFNPSIQGDIKRNYNPSNRRNINCDHSVASHKAATSSEENKLSDEIQVQAHSPGSKNLFSKKRASVRTTVEDVPVVTSPTAPQAHRRVTVPNLSIMENDNTQSTTVPRQSNEGNDWLPNSTVIGIGDVTREDGHDEFEHDNEEIISKVQAEEVGTQGNDVSDIDFNAFMTKFFPSEMDSVDDFEVPGLTENGVSK